MQRDPDERNRRGREAEELAAIHLSGLGWELLDRNHRCDRGEVDLVFRVGEAIRFVEVRSRTGGEQGTPEESVGPRKARRVVAAALDWAEAHRAIGLPLRFDVVAVTFGEAAPSIVHFPDAFDGDGRPGHW
jgi:putative endonuclease